MWIKICGIRDPDSASAVSACQPHAIGLNFYAESPRFVAPSAARNIVDVLPVAIETVAVFVNAEPREISECCREYGIRTAQLHGDESPEHADRLHRLHPELNLIRAFRVGSDGTAALADWIAECGQRQVPLRACLIDSRSDGAFGGTGKTAPWELVSSQYRSGKWPPLLLAGGLTPDNVATAIRTVRPWGVDVASGVESSPGVKDSVRVQEFIRTARSAPPRVDG